MTSLSSSPISQQSVSSSRQAACGFRLALPLLGLVVVALSLTRASLGRASFDTLHAEWSLSSAVLANSNSKEKDPVHVLFSLGGSSSGLTNSDSKEKDPVHVLFSLGGNSSEFLAEFEVSLKSALLNAPLDDDLQIHIMADGKAFDALPDIFNRTGLSKSYWRNQISISAYNVDPFIDRWSQKISLLYNKPIQNVVRHTIAAYFRLFVDDILPSTVKHVLYMDTDVLIMSNLANLWRQVDKNASFQWGRDRCSGFVILNVNKVHTIWEAASQVEDMKKFSQQNNQKYGDQLLLKAANYTRPELVAFLPDGWAMSIANGKLYRHTKHLVTYRPQAGMFHFNGGGRSKDSYFQSETAPIRKYPKSYGLAMYYVNLPWNWALFTGMSKIGNGKGYPLEIFYESTS